LRNYKRRRNRNCLNAKTAGENAKTFVHSAVYALIVILKWQGDFCLRVWLMGENNMKCKDCGSEMAKIKELKPPGLLHGYVCRRCESKLYDALKYYERLDLPKNKGER